MLAGVSICSPLALGFNCSKVSGLISCAPSPTGICTSSSESTWKASTHAIIGLNFPIIANIVHFRAGLNLCSADHRTMILRDKARVPGTHLSTAEGLQRCQLVPYYSNYWLLLQLLEHLLWLLENTVLQLGLVFIVQNRPGPQIVRQASAIPKKNHQSIEQWPCSKHGLSWQTCHSYPIWIKAIHSRIKHAPKNA